MKRKNDDEMVQTAVRLPQSLRNRLSRAGGERGLGEEIRSRLEASFSAIAEPADPQTRDLLEAIAFFDAEMFYHFGSWSKEPFAFEVMKAAVETLLAYHRPKGEVKAPPATDDKAAILYGPDTSPEPLGRLLVHAWTRGTQKRLREGEKK